MAANRKRPRVDYVSLNNLSSVVLYDTGRKPKGKFYRVDRVIERRRIAHVSTIKYTEMLLYWSIGTT